MDVKLGMNLPQNPITLPEEVHAIIGDGIIKSMLSVSTLEKTINDQRKDKEHVLEDATDIDNLVSVTMVQKVRMKVFIVLTDTSGGNEPQDMLGQDAVSIVDLLCSQTDTNILVENNIVYAHEHSPNKGWNNDVNPLGVLPNVMFNVNSEENKHFQLTL